MSSAAVVATAKPRPDTYNYVASASRETVIDHCVSGSFTSDQAIDTICSKGSRIEIRTLQEEEEKLVLVCTQLCFGKITCLKLMRSPIASTSSQGSSKEWLFVVTDRPHFFLFSFENGKLVERAFGKLGEMLSKPVAVPLVVVDQKSRFVLCHLFNGLLSVICFDGKTGGVKDTFITSLEELNVLDLEIVSSAQRQVLCVLHEDNRENRHVKTYELNPKNLREMLPGPWNQPHVEGTAHKLLAALEGVLVFSSSSVVHLRENTTATTAAAATATSAMPTSGGNANALAKSSAALITTIPLFFGRVEAVGYVELDGSRVLVGDELGSLYVLAIAPRTFHMTIEYLGDTSVATRLCYLDSGLVFVASRLGDSQLVRLPDDSSSSSSTATNAVEVLETFTNLGPIVSMCLMDLEKKGQLVTCSGGVKDGSLRIVRNGVGVDEQCAIDLPGILGMFAVKHTQQSEHDSFLVQSFSTETRVLGFSRQDNSTDVVLSELSFSPASKFQCDAPTLFCGNLNDDWMVQVNPNRVRFLKTSALSEDTMDTEEQEQHWDWPIPAGKRVTVASSFQGKNQEHLLLLGLTGGLLVVVERATNNTKLEVQMEHEISSACASGAVICVGLWSDLTLRVLDSDTGKQVHSTPAQQEDALATSMVFCRFSTLLHLLVGYGDGRLLIFCLDDTSGKFFSKRSIALGSQPVELTAFTDSITGSRYVFAACDRPSIVYCAPHAQDKVLLSNVNAPMSTVTRVAQFNSEQFPNCLALASDESLVIGMVNDVQKLHVKSIPLGERPHRIAHQPSSGAFGVCVHGNEDGGEEQQQGFAEICRLRLIDDRTFKVIDSFRFDETELPFCIISTTFGIGENSDTSKSYFVVGTAYTNDDDPEPSRGRILVFEVSKMEGDSERKLFVVTEKTVKGGVYDMCSLASGKLVAGVNAKIQIFSWTDRASSTAPTAAATAKNTNQDLLLQDASFHGHTLCLNVRAFGEHIVVGDLVKSVSLLEYDVKKNKVSEVSRALPPSWVTSLAVLEDTSFLISDADGNLVVLRPDGLGESGGAEEESALVTAGDFYWGDFINTFCLGSLTMRQDDTPGGGDSALAVRANPKLLFGTASGAIGVLATLTAKEFALLDRLQVAMDEVCIGVGMQRHSEWRAFRAHGKTHPSRGFIDGDLVETLMELDVGDLDRVCEKMNQGLTMRDATHTVHTEEPERVTTEDLLRLVEDLMRLH